MAAAARPYWTGFLKLSLVTIAVSLAQTVNRPWSQRLIGMWNDMPGSITVFSFSNRLSTLPSPQSGANAMPML